MHSFFWNRIIFLIAAYTIIHDNTLSIIFVNNLIKKDAWKNPKPFSFKRLIKLSIVVPVNPSDKIIDIGVPIKGDIIPIMIPDIIAVITPNLNFLAIIPIIMPINAFTIAKFKCE